LVTLIPKFGNYAGEHTWSYEKLLCLWNNGWPCTQTVSIGKPTKASQRRPPSTINWAYLKLKFFTTF
jgi:hypothetical protein